MYVSVTIEGTPAGIVDLSKENTHNRIHNCLEEHTSDSIDMDFPQPTKNDFLMGNIFKFKAVAIDGMGFKKYKLKVVMQQTWLY